MIHHDSRSYAVAASEAARHGRVKMEEITHKGAASAASVVNQVLSRVVHDSVVKAPAVRLRYDPEGGNWELSVPNDPLGTLHPHAFGQVLADAGVPKKFADDLAEYDVQANAAGRPRWGRDLTAHTVNTILGHRHAQRNLVRREGDVVKGFLSDRFKRLDSRPLLQAFVDACSGVGLQPIQGVSSDTKVRLRAVLPQVFEPVPNEVMIFGLEWGNSDYGDGGHCVQLWTMRVWCTNLAITEQCLRQVHLGAKLPDDVEFSRRTYELDTKRNASALHDVVLHAIGPDRVNGMVAAIRESTEEELKGGAVNARLKKYLERADAEKVAALFDGPDVLNLPPGRTAWRLSNAVSLWAQTPGLSPDRRLELEAVAGKLIPHTEQKVLEV